MHIKQWSEKQAAHYQDKSWRSKGGKNSQEKRRNNPEYYRKLGCPVGHFFPSPSRDKELAELVGIILGDGGITKYQLHITLNSIKDKDYSKYVRNLIQSVFSYIPSVHFRSDSNALVIVSTGQSLVSRLVEVGLSIGDKIANNASVPNWIGGDKELSRWCLRGLVDTDGGIFLHKYSVKGKMYCYHKLCFASMSPLLRDFVFETLSIYGFNPKREGPKNIWLYSKNETSKYLSLIGSSNTRVSGSYR